MAVEESIVFSVQYSVFGIQSMGHVNIEIKARCARTDAIRRMLKQRRADFKGVDHQVDTYFRCAHGRLKLREGNIECSLVYYDREDTAGPKRADVILYPVLTIDRMRMGGVWPFARGCGMAGPLDSEG